MCVTTFMLCVSSIVFVRSYAVFSRHFACLPFIVCFLSFLFVCHKSVPRTAVHTDGNGNPRPCLPGEHRSSISATLHRLQCRTWGNLPEIDRFIGTESNILSWVWVAPTGSGTGAKHATRGTLCRLGLVGLIFCNRPHYV